jgi:hypothetical protein
MKDYIRVYCPLCQSMPYPAQLDNAEKKEPIVRIMLMKVGGKVPGDPPVPGEYKKKGIGKAKGLIEYKDVTDENPELVKKYTRWFAERAVAFAEKNGLIEK